MCRCKTFSLVFGKSKVQQIKYAQITGVACSPTMQLLSVFYYAFSVRFQMKALSPLEFTIHHGKTLILGEVISQNTHFLQQCLCWCSVFWGFFVRPVLFLITLKSVFLHRCHKRRILVGPAAANIQMPISGSKYPSKTNQAPFEWVWSQAFIFYLHFVTLLATHTNTFLTHIDTQWKIALFTKQNLEDNK